MRYLFIHLLMILSIILFGCDNANTLATPDASVPIVDEYAVTNIALAGDISKSEAELSGLAWYGDYLILLPQYPERLGNNLFALPKQDILSFLDGETNQALTPRAIPLDMSGLDGINDFEGLEAIAFSDNHVFATIETSPGSAMLGYLAKGNIAPDLSGISLDMKTAVEIQPQANIANYTDETLLITQGTLLTIYEANGSNVNPSPMAHLFDANLTAMGTTPFPNVEYRITDATATDANNRFWAINYVFPDSIAKLNPAPDPLVTKYGIGPSHAKNNIVERLLEFEYTPTDIILTDTPPIQLALLSDETARNWEGIARLDERGFLLVTDKFPETILGFVPLP